MRIIKFTSLFAFILMLSCSVEDSISSETGHSPQSYHFNYMFYPTGMAMSPTLDNLVRISYDNNNKITKRLGGFLYYSGGSGLGTGYSDLVYDDVSYVNNEIHIVRKTSMINYSVSPFKIKLKLDNNNRIVKRMLYQERVYPYNDTINYFYNSLGLISETFKGNLNSFNVKAKYYYNQNGNLDSIVTKKHYQNEPYNSKEKEIFSNFDTTPNPLNKLIIFEETFLRALSKNNFSKYEKNIYDANNNLVTWEVRNWNLIYDSSGNVNFNVN